MNAVGRPTEDELDRFEELADEYFVGDSWTIEASLWDDGDVHFEAFTTLGNKHRDGYPNDLWNHRQKIVYERGDEFAHYYNVLEWPHEEHQASAIQKLNEFEIEW